MLNVEATYLVRVAVKNQNGYLHVPHLVSHDDAQVDAGVLVDGAVFVVPAGGGDVRQPHQTATVLIRGAYVVPDGAIT